MVISVQEVERMFQAYGMDPTIHFDGTYEAGRAERIAASLNAGTLSLSEFNTTLATQGTIAAPAQQQGTSITEAQVIAMFEGYGQDPYTHFDGTYEAGRPARIAASISSGQLTLDQFNATLTSFSPKLIASGVMPGGQTINVDGRWYQIYEFPVGSGNFVAYRFNSQAQLEATFGKNPPFASQSQSWFDANVLMEGSAEEIIGRTDTSFAQFTSRLMQEGAMASGIRDPSLAGKMANDPEMQAIMAQAILGDWTPAQILAEQRRTRFWTEVLYPGIENLFNRTTNPEGAWREYAASVAPALAALGYARSFDGTFNTQIKQMLDKNIDAGTFLSQVPTFIRATQNAEFATIFNQWAEMDLGRSVGFNDWFNLLAGESLPELDGIAERATLAWTAQNQASGVSTQQIRNLASKSQLTEQEMVAAFSDFNRSVLALGDQGLAKYGLNRDEVLSVAAGVKPASGRSIDEVKLLIAKTAHEQGLADDERINFFIGFDTSGRPNRPGLQSLAPEGA